MDVDESNCSRHTLAKRGEIERMSSCAAKSLRSGPTDIVITGEVKVLFLTKNLEHLCSFYDGKIAERCTFQLGGCQLVFYFVVFLHALEMIVWIC